ncbi:BPSL0761 family protein [Caballeronia novacaledonica]|uniref:Uncharacterized protein n=1 Tax=Caballeronia novacaledonica TaxID=1544861 RepID=A0AA37IAE9_9BURK|nr:BPSL0761 family protein [Caballeronia novacaledonica]GJH26301.1 hypothetical protein CBA19CS42_17315 [Caballeronia novacaledonica]
MTHPQQREKALADARRFLEALYESEQPLMWDLVRTVAMNVLRHYPRDDGIAEPAAGEAPVLPSVLVAGTPCPQIDSARVGKATALSPVSDLPPPVSPHLLQAYSLLLSPQWRGMPPILSALHALDCICLCCIALAAPMGLAVDALDDVDKEVAQATMSAAKMPLDDIDKVLAVVGWCYSPGAPEALPCEQFVLWDIAERMYLRALACGAGHRNDGGSRGHNLAR